MEAKIGRMFKLLEPWLGWAGLGWVGLGEALVWSYLIPTMAFKNAVLLITSPLFCVSSGGVSGSPFFKLPAASPDFPLLHC